MLPTKEKRELPIDFIKDWLKAMDCLHLALPLCLADDEDQEKSNRQLAKRLLNTQPNNAICQAQLAHIAEL